MSAKAIITGIIALMLLGCPYSGHAQRLTKDKEKARQWPVSYTHLTLPTICSV